MSRTLVSLAILCTICASASAWTWQGQSTWSSTYSACAGTKQSPINVVRTGLTQSLTTKMTLAGSYNTITSGAKLKNVDGTAQKISPKDGTNFGKTTYNSKEYTLVQFHTHQPSEHSFDGMKYDMEMHFVHQQGTNSDYLVLTVFYNIGAVESAFLKSVKYDAGSATNNGSVDITDSFNVWTALGEVQGNQEFIYYSGSFTTPPCTEAVVFVLFRDYLMMSKNQWDKYATSLPNAGISYTAGTGNFRSVQALNSRTVTLQYGVVTAANLLTTGIAFIMAVMFLMN